MMPRDSARTRETIVKAASALFYTHGVRASNLDRIAEKAGVTKRTVYYHFSSKDELIEAYLTARDGPNLAAMRSWFQKRDTDLASGVRAVFSGMKDASQHRKWRGCGYLRTAGEFANTPGLRRSRLRRFTKKRRSMAGGGVSRGRNRQRRIPCAAGDATHGRGLFRHAYSS
ncbi:helix-turn-helix domain-containing protein [Hoeflea sp. CAU 1731]